MTSVDRRGAEDGAQRTRITVAGWRSLRGTPGAARPVCVVGGASHLLEPARHDPPAAPARARSGQKDGRVGEPPQRASRAATEPFGPGAP